MHGAINHCFEGARQTQMVKLAGMQIARNLADLTDRLRSEVADGFKLQAQISSRGFVRERQLRVVLDEQQILAQAVVQLRSDASALGFLR